MNLFSLFRSSSAEIIYSKKIVTYAYLVIVALITVQGFASVQEFIHAYTTTHRFDTTTAGFIVSTILLFVPLWITGALITRACLQRMRLALWAKHAFTFADYTTQLSPAEAGFLVDYEYNHREFVATLLDLHYRGVLTVSINGETVRILRGSASPAGLSAYEQFIVESFPAAGESPSYVSFDDPRLVVLARNAQLLVIKQLAARGLIKPERLPRRGLRIAFRCLYIAAGLVALVYCAALIFSYHQLMSVQPLYPMSMAEVWTMVLLSVATLSIMVSGAWPRYTTDPKQPTYAAWTAAAGFMLYLRTVYSDRFAPMAIQSQDAQTVRTYAPYAVAFGIIRSDLATVTVLLSP